MFCVWYLIMYIIMISDNYKLLENQNNRYSYSSIQRIKYYKI